MNSLLAYLLLWPMMAKALEVSFWLPFPLILVASGLLVRIFIIFHDCGHGSFLPNRKVNNLIGFVTGVLTFTPYQHWRWEHANHHASVGDLGRRGLGDIWTMTLKEYQSSPRRKQILYRLWRNPLFLFFVFPPLLFLIVYRLPRPQATPGDRRSVHSTTLGVLAMALIGCLLFGWPTYLALQGSIVMLIACVGMWLFYVQHQFDGVYWSQGEDWAYLDAALGGSSFYKLPKILQWFTGNIGFHHLHHLSPRIPNYHLELCHEALGLDKHVKPLSMGDSWRCALFRLWDEENRCLIPFP